MTQTPQESDSAKDTVSTQTRSCEKQQDAQLPTTQLTEDGEISQHGNSLWDEWNPRYKESNALTVDLIEDMSELIEALKEFLEENITKHSNKKYHKWKQVFTDLINNVCQSTELLVTLKAEMEELERKIEEENQE